MRRNEWEYYNVNVMMQAATHPTRISTCLCPLFLTFKLSSSIQTFSFSFSFSPPLWGYYGHFPTQICRSWIVFRCQHSKESKLIISMYLINECIKIIITNFKIIFVLSIANNIKGSLWLWLTRRVNELCIMYYCSKKLAFNNY